MKCIHGTLFAGTLLLAGLSPAQNLTVEINTTVELRHGFFINYSQSHDYVIQSGGSWDLLPVGRTTLTATQPGPVNPAAYLFLATYTDPLGVEGVSISLNTATAQNAIAGALTWGQIFNFEYYRESNVVTALHDFHSSDAELQQNADALLKTLWFVEQSKFPAIGQSATMTLFSGASNGGHIVATSGPVPEPASLSCLVLGLTILKRKRRK